MKQNGIVCLPGPALLFFIFRFEYLISGRKSYRDVRETGPLAGFVLGSREFTNPRGHACEKPNCFASSQLGFKAMHAKGEDN